MNAVHLLTVFFKSFFISTFGSSCLIVWRIARLFYSCRHNTISDVETVAIFSLSLCSTVELRVFAIKQYIVGSSILLIVFQIPKLTSYISSAVDTSSPFGKTKQKNAAEQKLPTKKSVRERAKIKTSNEQHPPELKAGDCNDVKKSAVDD